MASRPPEPVLRAFGAYTDPLPLTGGQGGTWRAGSIVLKPVSNETEAAWSADALARLEGPGFRVPRPIPVSGGGWTFAGWCAQEYVEAQHAGRNGGRWPETLAACRAFHTALEGIPRPAFLETRDDAWSEADRMAFGERGADPLPALADVIARLERLVRPVEAPSQVIHGDFTANVLFADGQPPCVIDFSPYWRPAPFALAVVVSDAISWAGASPGIIELCADVPDFDQWLVRATLRRVWENDQHSRRGRPDAERYLAEYLPMVALLEARAG